MVEIINDIETPEKYKVNVVKKENKLEIVEVISNREIIIRAEIDLEEGELVVIDEVETGIVSEKIDGKKARVKIYEELEKKPEKVRIKKWWEVKHKKSKILVSDNFWVREKGKGYLYCKCEVRDGHRAGAIGWDLIYTSNQVIEPILIAIGNDYDTPCLCYLETTGYFPKGVYTLNVQRFYKVGYIRQGSDSTKWDIKEPTKSLICSHNEGNRPIILID